MAKRTAALKKKNGVSNGTSAPVAAAVAPVESDGSDSDQESGTESGTGSSTEQALGRRNPTFSLSSPAGKVVLVCSLAMLAVEFYQLGDLFTRNGCKLDQVFLDESWEIIKSYWQTKLMALTFVLKTIYSPK